MTLAAETREAVDSHPFLRDALRAGVVNYSAAARFLDVDGETDAVVAALRRYADDLPAYDPAGRESPVSMRSGLGETDPADALLQVGDLAVGPDGGDLTGIVATGEAGPAALRHVLGALAASGVGVEAAGASEGSLVVVVPRRAGPDAVRAAEDALETAEPE